MKNVRSILLLLSVVLLYTTAIAQSAVEYNNTIVRELNPVSAATAAYLDAATHGRDATDANAKLALLVRSLEVARTHLTAIKPYKGYTGLRDSILSYVNLGYTSTASFSGVLTDEEMAALSYEKMKAYMETSDVLNDRLLIYGALIKREQRRFAEKNGFEIETEPKQMEDKFKQVQEVFRYYHQVFLLFFRCNKLENAFVEASNTGKAESLEATRTQLLQATTEGLERIQPLPPINGDASLRQAGKEALQFFDNEAREKMPLIIAYFQKKEKFDKQSAAINKVPAKDRTEQMITSYNANLKAVNDAVGVYNATNQELNTKRTEVTDRFNKATIDFVDRNSPKMK